MSLKPQNSYVAPEGTVRVAEAISPDGSFYLRIYDTFGTLFQDDDFAALFPQDGQVAEAPFRFMLVLILQFPENITDRQAADSVHTRVDWKYLLSLQLTDAGFHCSVLSEFRTRLIQVKAEVVLFEKLLNVFREKGFLKGQRQQRTDSTHILGAIRAINRVELVGETMRRVLNTLAVVAPDWMRNNSHPDWIDRYGNRIEDARLPKSATKRAALADQIGADGLVLLGSIFGSTAPSWFRELSAVKIFWRYGSRITPGKKMDIYDGARMERCPLRPYLSAHPTMRMLTIAKNGPLLGLVIKYM
jgi:transposase